MYTTKMNGGVRSAVAFLKRCGCTPVKGCYHQYYHYNSGFFTSPKGLLWYWSTADDRLVTTCGGAPRGIQDIPLVRTARDTRDYCGGHNNYPKADEELRNLIKRRDEQPGLEVIR